MVSGQLKALLGVLAVAGYQNREKIADFLRGLNTQQTSGANRDEEASSTQTSGGDLPGKLGGGRESGGIGSIFDSLTSGGTLSGGLSDLLKTFQQNGFGQKAESWIKPGANDDINADELSEAIGPEVLDELAAKTRLSREEILARLSKDLPQAVDELTPDGTIPSAQQVPKP
ncbi:YidB family protein [Agrobacterium pusense]|uniref:YidB family protein n=1 Tax=Agrobacterium pusense TaxID=648995 RepID=UPI003FD5C4BC